MGDTTRPVDKEVELSSVFDVHEIERPWVAVENAPAGKCTACTTDFSRAQPDKIERQELWGPAQIDSNIVASVVSIITRDHLWSYCRVLCAAFGGVSGGKLAVGVDPDWGRVFDQLRARLLEMRERPEIHFLLAVVRAPRQRLAAVLVRRRTREVLLVDPEKQVEDTKWLVDLLTEVPPDVVDGDWIVTRLSNNFQTDLKNHPMALLQMIRSLIMGFCGPEGAPSTWWHRLVGMELAQCKVHCHTIDMKAVEKEVSKMKLRPQRFEARWHSDARRIFYVDHKLNTTSWTLPEDMPPLPLHIRELERTGNKFPEGTDLGTIVATTAANIQGANPLLAIMTAIGGQARGMMPPRGKKKDLFTRRGVKRSKTSGSSRRFEAELERKRQMRRQQRMGMRGQPIKGEEGVEGTDEVIDSAVVEEGGIGGEEGGVDGEMFESLEEEVGVGEV